MSREFFRFDLTGLDGAKHSVLAHQIQCVSELRGPAKSDKADQVIGSRITLGNTVIDVSENPEFIFQMDKWQIFRKAGK